MSIFDQALKLVGQVLQLVGEPPGSYAYHLVLLFALQSAAAIALSQWRAKRDAARARLSLAAGFLFVLRLILLITAFLAAVSFFDPLTLLPPLDRAASALTLLVVLWAFAFPQTQRLADAAAAGLTLLILLALGISLPLWAQEVAGGAVTYLCAMNGQSAGAGAIFFNCSIQDTGWEITQAILLIGGGLLLLLRRQSDWLIGVAFLAVLFAGHMVQALLPLPGNVPNAVRLAELIALPLFAVMVYRRAHAPAVAPAATFVPETTAAPPAVPAAPPPEPTPRLPPPLDPKTAAALTSLGAASSLEELAQLMLLALAHAFRSDLCLLITPPDAFGLASIAGGYDLIREKFLPGAPLPLSEVPDLAAALYQRHATRLHPDQHGGQIRYLTTSLGVDYVGPALMAPCLSEEGALLAAVVVISVYSGREWSPDDEQLMEALTEPLAAAIRRAEKIAQIQQDFEQQKVQLEDAQQAHQSARETAEQLASELNAAQAEVERLTLELDRVQAEMDQQREEAESLTRELKARYEAEVRQSELTDEINLQQAQRESAERERLEIELSAAQERAAALVALEARFEELAREAETQQQRAAELTAELERARAEAQAAQAQAEAHQQRAQQLAAELEQLRAEAQARSQKPATMSDDHLTSTLAPEAFAPPDLARLRAELENELGHLAQERDQLKEDLQVANENLRLQSALTADLQTELTTYKQLEFQLRRELELTRSELKKFVEASEANLPLVPEETSALAEAQSALAAAEAELAEKSRQLTEALDQLSRKERQLAKAQETLTALAGQTKSLEALRAELAERDRQLTEQARTVEQLQGQLAEAQAQLHEKERQLTAAVSDLAALAQTNDQPAGTDHALTAALAAPTAEPPGAPRFTPPFSAPSYEVIASLVQELRQPMSSIVGYSDLLLSESVGILGALQRKFLERIMASCERMEALLDDLIRVTALDTGRLKMVCDSLDVMAVIEEAILGCSAQFREKSINLRLDLADNLPPVFADRDALRQIISHLLNNAASASALDGEVTLSVRVQPAAGAPQGGPGDGLFISVRDSGGGIAPEDQPRVFSRTYRADAPLIAGLGDTAGMGLFIAKALTEAQGGRIWLTSELGQGSTFSVMLPVAGQPVAAGGNGSNPPDN